MKSLESARRQALVPPLSASLFWLSLGSVIFTVIELQSTNRSVIDFLSRGGIYTFILTPLIFGCLYWYSKKGSTLVSAYIILILFAFYGLGTVYNYGAATPQGVLTIGLTIIAAGAMLGLRATYIASGLLSAVYILIFALQETGTIQLAKEWTSADISLADVVVFIISFSVIVFSVIVFQRETDRALHESLKLQNELTKERDSLEETVKERTSQLKEAQYKRVLELSKFADLGRHSSSLIHDLINHLNAVQLSLELLKDTANSDNSKARESLNRANKAAELMDSFIRSTRRDMALDSTITEFEVGNTLEEVITSLAYRARMYQVNVRVDEYHTINLYTDQVKFFRVCQNIISNAIDSFENVVDARIRIVSISFTQEGESYVLKVSDNGCGMTPEQLDRVFELFYTTKSIERGTGIGMSTVKDIVIHAFGGTVEIQSALDKGTTATVTIPKATVSLAIKPSSHE